MSTLLQLVHFSHWLAAIALWLVAAYCLTLRKKPIILSLIAFCFLSGLWALLAALIVATPDLATKIALNRLKLVCPVLLPSSILAIAINIKFSQTWHKIVFILSSIVPTISLVLLSSTDTHQLLVGSYDLLIIAGREYLTFENGSWFSIHSANSRIIVLSTVGALLLIAKNMSAQHRARVMLVLFAILLPFIVDTLAVHFWPVLRIIQLTPTLLLLSACLLMHGIVKNNFVDIIPLAQDFVLNNSNDVYLIFDEDDRLVDFNKMAAKELDLSRQQLGYSLSDLSLSSEKISKVLSLGDAAPFVYSLNEEFYEFVRNDCLDEKNIRRGLVIAGKNVTLRIQNERFLESINEIQTRILAVVSHDFTGNLASSILLAQSALRAKDRWSREELISCIQNIEVISQQNALLVQDLLEWSKRSLGMNVEGVDIDLMGLITDVCDFVEYQASEKNLDVITSMNGPTAIKVDAAALRTVARNLLSNAIEASHKSGRVWMTFATSEQNLQLEVKDQGRGIDEESCKRIFDLNKSDSQGLGLFLCHEFVARMNGSIEVRSELGVGTTFLVIVPLLS